MNVIDDPSDIEVYGTMYDTPTAAYTGDGFMGREEIVKFMHYPLPHPLPPSWPRIVSRGLKGKEGKLTGIPAPYPLPPEIEGLIGYVEAMTCWTEIGADTTTKTLFIEKIPKRGLHHLFELLHETVGLDDR